MIKYIKIFSLLFCFTIVGANVAMAQKKAKTEVVKVTIKAIITDTNNKPVSGATISCKEGTIETKSNDKGEFEIGVPVSEQIFIEAEGYISKSLMLNGQESVFEIKLLKANGNIDVDQLVNLPFGQLRNKQIVGATTSLKPEEFENYDSRNGVLNSIISRSPGMFGNRNVRGLGDALVVVDGIPRGNFADYNIQEVDKITILRDATARIMYGAQASNGVILITTKRGAANRKTIKVSTEYGISDPISYPQYLNNADFASLYNEARTNDGKLPVFSAAEIEGFKSGTDNLRYPDENYYSSTYLKSVKPFSNVVAEFSGGNSIAQYFMLMGYNYSDSYLNVGEGANENWKRMNMRANIDFKINDYLKMNVDGFVLFNVDHHPLGDFWDNSTTYRPDLSPMLIPIDQVTQADVSGQIIPREDLGRYAKLIDNKYLLGGESQFGNSNIYGDLALKGYSNYMDRTVQFNTGFDLDMRWLTEGLSFKGYFSFDMFNTFITSQTNTYAYYQLDKTIYDRTNGDSIVVKKTNNDSFTGTQGINSASFNRKYGFFGNLNYHRVFKNDHEITASAVAYADVYQPNAAIHSTNNATFGWRANYTYKSKYVAEFDGAVVGSAQLSEENRWGTSPALGLGWIVSEENFAKNLSFLNYLKLKGSWGIIKSDDGISGYYSYDETYQIGNAYTYKDGTNKNKMVTVRTQPSPSLTFAQRNEISAGFEAQLFKNSLWIEGNYFISKQTGLYTILNDYYPQYMPFLPYENYDEKQNKGVELGLNYSKQFGDFGISFGGNMLYSVPKNLKISEPNYVNEYQKTVGQPSDAMKGFVSKGFFTPDDFAANGSLKADIPIPAFGKVAPGDIRYEDLNGDGIVDDNDQKMIGNSDPRLGYGLNLKLSYKHFELFALGQGNTGEKVYYKNGYYLVTGDNRYSVNALNRWTPETAATATHPRLTTNSNTNNSKNSTFWLYQNNWFTLNTLQLSYTLPTNVVDKTFFKTIRLYAMGGNLMMVSPIKEKKQLNIGSAPQARNYSVGIKMSF